MTKELVDTFFAPSCSNLLLALPMNFLPSWNLPKQWEVGDNVLKNSVKNSNLADGSLHF